MKTSKTPVELEADIGETLKALRLRKNLDQKTLAERAGISLSAVKNLERGAGSSLKSLVSVLRALGREDWLQAIAPVASVNPMTMTHAASPRQRASARRRLDKSA